MYCANYANLARKRSMAKQNVVIRRPKVSRNNGKHRHLFIVACSAIAISFAVKTHLCLSINKIVFSCSGESRFDFGCFRIGHRLTSVVLMKQNSSDPVGNSLFRLIASDNDHQFIVISRICIQRKIKNTIKTSGNINNYFCCIFLL
ncbi:MAG: hypothetical protein H6Q17_1822 [Bacteroidetes bacterium]|nr:hypothetical protein [Bacteroidota bacterium]